MHVKFPDVRIPEILFIAVQIFLSHFLRIDEMNLRVLHIDIFPEPGEQVCIILIFDRHRTESGKAVHEAIRRLITHFKKTFKLFSCFCLLLFVFGKTGKKRNHQLRLQPGAEFPTLIQVRTSKDTMIDMDVFPLNQLSHKAAAQRGADRAIQASSMFFFYVLFYLLRDCNHIGENSIASVKSVVINTDQVILLSQSIQYSAEVCLIIAGCPRQQHQGLSAFQPHFRKFHL